MDMFEFISKLPMAGLSGEEVRGCTLCSNCNNCSKENCVEADNTNESISHKSTEFGFNFLKRIICTANFNSVQLIELYNLIREQIEKAKKEEQKANKVIKREVCLADAKITKDPNKVELNIYSPKTRSNTLLVVPKVLLADLMLSQSQNKTTDFIDFIAIFEGDKIIELKTQDGKALWRA